MKKIKDNSIRLLLILLICQVLSQGTQIKFQKHLQTNVDISLFFYATAGETYHLKIQYEKQIEYFSIYLLDANHIDFPTIHYTIIEDNRQNTNIYQKVFVPQTSGFYFLGNQIYSQTYNQINVIRLQVKNNGIILKQNQFPVSRMNENQGTIIVPITTTQACKVIFYWDGPDCVLSVYSPPTTTIDGTPVTTYPPGTKNFPIQLNVAGTWYVIAFTNTYVYVDMKNVTITITTFSDSPCTNKCFQKGSDIQLVPGTKTGQCMCDPTIGLYYNSTSEKCDCINPLCGTIDTPSLCNNGILEAGQVCDNGKNIGCSFNCIVDSGYKCTGEIGSESSCNPVCGDGIKTQNQQCDNENQLGCFNCIISPGYTCKNSPLAKSLCYQVCGDGILTVSEQCDNGNKPGCDASCKIVPGYVCTGSIGTTSDCQIRCGDGILGGYQKCDNGNKIGCSTNCVPDIGYTCINKIGTISICTSICGDSIRTSNQQCDNGKKIGCLTCIVPDIGYSCTGAVGTRSICLPTCGDGIRVSSQICDNGNKPGCTNCRINIGYTCTGAINTTSTCTTTCGDSIKAGTEECDNGNKLGCRNCIIEPNYTCKLSSNGRTSICRT